MSMPSPARGGRSQVHGQGLPQAPPAPMSAPMGHQQQRSPASPGGLRFSDEFGTSPAPPRGRKGSSASSVSGGSSRLSGVKRGAGSLEEGDYVWVNDPSSVCIPAIVVRSGYAFDGETEQEHQVTVVHTEDGEEREIRDQPLVKLPQCHHPKKLLPLELHDLSSVPLMIANVRLTWGLGVLIAVTDGFCAG